MSHDRKDCCSTLHSNLFNNIISFFCCSKIEQLRLMMANLSNWIPVSVPDISLSLSGLIVGAKTFFYFKYKTIVVDMNERKKSIIM